MHRTEREEESEFLVFASARFTLVCMLEWFFFARSSFVLTNHHFICFRVRDVITDFSSRLCFFSNT
jgi:hypothetical protein